VNHRRLAIVAALSLLAACGSDSATNVIDAISGSLSFNYTGGGGGSFSATGAITSAALANSPFTTTWAMGFKDSINNSTNIAANIPRTSTTSDFAIIAVKGQSTGTFNLDATCAPTGASTCNELTLWIGQSAAFQSWGSVCALDSGTITISRLSSTNAVGTFSGSGQCVTSAATVSSWVVTNGAFDVPLLPNGPTILY
jgi:hypothetical protein